MDELKRMRIWIGWNYSYKNGKKTKVPCSITGGETGTDEAHSSTWATYDETVAAAKKHGFSGIGFVLPDGYFLLDIDGRPIDDPYVQTLLSRFGSYAEVSVSGNGVHITRTIWKARFLTSVSGN